MYFVFFNNSKTESSKLSFDIGDVSVLSSKIEVVTHLGLAEKCGLEGDALKSYAQGIRVSGPNGQTVLVGKKLSQLKELEYLEYVMPEDHLDNELFPDVLQVMDMVSLSW